jgi:hypothetical protein
MCVEYNVYLAELLLKTYYTTYNESEIYGKFQLRFFPTPHVFSLSRALHCSIILMFFKAAAAALDPLSF